ncbi:hypothetical protein [Sphingobium ummariense]|uniref:hypothetical protein n=1 Tax=Sphingobium ummariense TaxID=420994 RepID=UPI00137799AC|nr:hypothetical protein [Sphingobium ummariense]
MLQGQQIVHDDVDRNAAPPPSRNLSTVTGQPVRGQIESQEDVARHTTQQRAVRRRQGDLTRDRVEGRRAIAPSRHGRHRHDSKVIRGIVQKLKEDRSNDPLDAGARIVLRDRGHIDEQAPETLPHKRVCPAPANPPEQSIKQAHSRSCA